ncbi:MAG: hypothetical protein LBQ27_06180 [Clostridiales bacterium]|jgi:stage III sporulation protein AG|nr:hypothetical protein [Clostridiales bacterium]
MVNQFVETKATVTDAVTEKDGTSQFRNLYGKLKSVKHIKIIAAAVIIAIVLLIVAATYGSIKTTAKEASDPLRELEMRLAAILSEIDGAGKVDVMIMFDGGIEVVTANTVTSNTNKTTDSSGGVDRVTETSTETSTPILINDNGVMRPVILKEIMPDILGVMIVAEGADNMTVRTELLRASSKVLDVSSDIIEIFTKQKSKK